LEIYCFEYSTGIACLAVKLVLIVVQKILIEAKQLDKQFCSWFASDCILSNLSTVICQVMVGEYWQESSTEVALPTDIGDISASDCDDVIAIGDDSDEIDFPPPGMILVPFCSINCFLTFIFNIFGYRLHMGSCYVWVAGVRIDPLHFLAGCRKRRLNQAPLNLHAWPHLINGDGLE